MGKRISHITISEAQATQAIQHATLPLDALQPHPRNYRRHPDMQLDRLAASLARFGQVRSIVVQAGAPGRYLVVAGHGVVEAARRLGSVRELRADVIPADWTPEQVEGYLVADNQHAAGADDDLARLAELLQAQADAGYDLATLGSDDDELAALLDSLEGDEVDTDRRDVDDPDGGGDDFDTTPDESGPTRTQPGDLWQLGAHRLLCGDSTKREDVARLMDGVRAGMMWTDPPYGVSYVGKTKRALTLENDGSGGLPLLLECAFALADAEALDGGAAIYVAGPAGQQGVVFINAFNAQWPLRQMLAWVKDSMVLGHSDYHYRHEMIIYGFKPGRGRRGRGGEGWYGDNAQTSVFEVPRPKRSEEHPTMKPLALIAPMMANSSSDDGAVYDPFCGSGSTLITAERLGRTCYAIEIDPRYCDVILRRWEAETGRDASLLARVSVGAQEVAANGE